MITETYRDNVCIALSTIKFLIKGSLCPRPTRVLPGLISFMSSTSLETTAWYEQTLAAPWRERPRGKSPQPGLCEAQTPRTAPPSRLSTHGCWILGAAGFPGCGAGKGGRGSGTPGDGGCGAGRSPFSRVAPCVAAACECLPARALPRGRVAPTGAELTGLVLGESLAHCSVSGEPLRSFC